MTKLMFRTLAGSRLYGVETEDSDYDYKGVFIEDLQDLLKKERNVKTFSGEEEEEEMFSLNYYLQLLGQGQVIPVDMLFAPKQFWTHSSLEWEMLHDERRRFVSANILPFVGYAKGQAMKYGIKGNKLTTVDAAIALLKKEATFDEMVAHLSGMEGVENRVENAAGGPIRHLVICGKSFSETTKFELWAGPLLKLKASYGKRAEAATGGVDLKAQYHTMRICSEAIELLTSGELTFPRPEVDVLRKIRAGEYSATQLAEMIDLAFAKVKEAETTTKLQATPDFQRMQELNLSFHSAYLREIL